MKNLHDMLQDLVDIHELKNMGLDNDEIAGYIEFFAPNVIKPLSTVFGDIDVENNEQH